MAGKLLQLARHGESTVSRGSDLPSLVRDLSLALIATAEPTPALRALLERARRARAEPKPRAEARRISPGHLLSLIRRAPRKEAKVDIVDWAERMLGAATVSPPAPTPPYGSRRGRRAARAPRLPSPRRRRHLGRSDSARAPARAAGRATSPSSPARTESPAATAWRS